VSYYPPQQSHQVGLGGRITPGVKGLLIANVGVFIFQVLAMRLADSPIEPIFWLRPEDAVGKLLRPHDPDGGVMLWQLVTYMFLHSTYWLGHLLLNMLMLWMFGTEVERAWGTRRFIRYYFICGIGAAITTCLTFWDSKTIGASGAVFGVMLAYAMMFPNRVIYLWYLFPMQARSFILICTGIELFSLFGLQDGVAHIAHLGGMLFGYLYLKRAWRIGPFVGELRWRLRRRRFKVLPRDDDRYPFH
jgi:membrane associated rhomboid family serine protease